MGTRRFTSVCHRAMDHTRVVLVRGRVDAGGEHSMSGWKRFFAAGTAVLVVGAVAPVIAAAPVSAASGGQLTEICVNSLTGAVVGTNGSVACNLVNQVDYTVAATGATGAIGAT